MKTLKFYVENLFLIKGTLQRHHYDIYYKCVQVLPITLKEYLIGRLKLLRCCSLTSRLILEQLFITVMMQEHCSLSSKR